MDFHCLLKQLFRKNSSNAFLHIEGDEVTYATMERRVNTLSCFFRMQGCRPGAHIVYLTGSSRSYIEVMLACIQAGLTFCPIGAWQDDPGFLDCVLKLEPEFLFCDPDSMSVSLQEMVDHMPQTRFVLRGGTRYRNAAFLSYQQLVTRQLIYSPDAFDDKTAVLKFPSQSLNHMKAFSHREIVAYLEYCCQNLAHMPQRTLMSLPLITGCCMQEVLYAIAGGDCLYLIDKFSAKDFIKTVEWNQITCVFLTPFLINAISSDIRYLKGDLSSIQLVHLGQAALYPETEEQLKALLSPNCIIEKLTGFPTPCFALRMSAEELCTPFPEDQNAKVNAAGYPLDGHEVKVDSDSYYNLAPIYLNSGRGWEAICAKGWMDSHGLVYLVWDSSTEDIDAVNGQRYQTEFRIYERYNHADEKMFLLPVDYTELYSSAHSAPQRFAAEISQLLCRLLNARGASITLYSREISREQVRDTIIWQLDNTLPKISLPEEMIDINGNSRAIQDLMGGDENIICCPIFEKVFQVLGYFCFIESSQQQVAPELLRVLVHVLSSLARLHNDYWETAVRLKMFKTVSDLSDNTISFTRLENKAMLYYANEKACELINLGRNNQFFAAMMENAQKLNMEKLQGGAQSSSHSFFFTNSDHQKLWVNYRAECVEVDGNRYAITFGTKQESARTVQHLEGLLTEREYAVVRCLARGLSNPEISAELHISVNTVKYHISNLYRKLQVSSRSELIASIVG